MTAQLLDTSRRISLFNHFNLTLWNVDSSPEELEVLHDTLWAIFGQCNAKLSEHALVHL